MLDLNDKVLVLSGANGGIPRAFARVFRDCGAKLALSDLDAEALQAFADDPEYAPYAKARQAGSVTRLHVIDDTDVAGAIPYLPKG